MNAACNWLMRTLKTLADSLRGDTRPELTRRAVRLTVATKTTRMRGPFVRRD